MKGSDIILWGVGFSGAFFLLKITDTVDIPWWVVAFPVLAVAFVMLVALFWAMFVIIMGDEEE